MKSLPIDTARRREIAARHHLDHRTLERAIIEGASVLRGMTADRARAALAELGLPAEPSPPRSERA